MRKSPVRHKVVSKKGKVFFRGKGVMDPTQERLRMSDKRLVPINSIYTNKPIFDVDYSAAESVGMFKIGKVVYDGGDQDEETITLPISSLYPTQEKLNTVNLQSPPIPGKLPRVYDIMYKGKNVNLIIDGHHTIAKAIKRGEKNIKVACIHWNLEKLW
jgi:hypothetical protein